MSTDLDVVTLGEAMLMLVAGEPGPLEGAQTFHKRTAGAETNVAIGLSRLGLKVGWASRLGDDSMARYLLGDGGVEAMLAHIGDHLLGPREGPGGQAPDHHEDHQHHHDGGSNIGRHQDDKLIIQRRIGHVNRRKHQHDPV